MKKTIALIVLVCMLLQSLTACSFFSVKLTEEDKEEMRQSVEEMQNEISDAFNEIKNELTGNHSNTYQAKAEELSAFLMENIGVTTVQYALMVDGKIVLSNMVGVNDAWNKPVFCIASSSKMYVTAAVMILVDQGKLDLDTPVVHYMPEFTMADERYKEITPRMLLNHSSGIYGTNMAYGNSTSLGAPSTVGRNAFFENKKNEILKANPGEIAVYCNDGFVLSEFLVEKVSGMTYTDFIKKNIAIPLGLTYTTTAFDPALNPDNITAAPGADGNLMPIEYMNYPGTGGIYSTAEEMCQFGRLFMGDFPEILSMKSAELTLKSEFLKGLWIDEDLPNMVGYGLGWDDVTVDALTKYGIRAVRKGGDATFHHADLTVLPDLHISMAVLSAGGNSTFNGMISSAVLLEYLSNEGIIVLKDDNFMPTAPVKVDMPEELKKYEGLYGAGTAFSRAVQVTIVDGEVFVPGGMNGMIPDMKYVYIGNGEFASEDSSATIYFKEEANGNTYLIQAANQVFPGLGSVMLAGHEFQKLEPQVLSKVVETAWQARVGKQYFCVNEMYNSSNYLDSMMVILSPKIDVENGYVGGSKIVDANKAVNVIQIPVMSGRDNYDLSFFQSNGKSYMNRIGQVFISEEHVVPFEIANGKSVLIGADGYSQWFSIDAATAGKPVKITNPDKASVFIYDENMMLSAYSINAGEQTFTIPSGGFIVFAGAAGAEFKLA